MNFIKKNSFVISVIALVISIFLVIGIFSYILVDSNAKYANTSKWDNYLESNNFYFYADKLDSTTVNNSVNYYNLGDDIEFNIYNFYGGNASTKDIDYDLTCSTNNSNYSCTIDDDSSSVSDSLESSYGCFYNGTSVNLTQSECESSIYTSVPVRDSLNDYSWAEIKLIADALAQGYFEDDSDLEYYNITLGDTKTATVEGEEVEFRLVGLYHDVDENDEYLGFTFEQASFNFSSNFVMSNYSEDFGDDGWDNSSLLTQLNNIEIDSELDAVISAASKPSVTSVSDGELTYVTSKLWIMSETEIANSQDYTYDGSEEGYPYEYYEDYDYSNASRIKYDENNNALAYWTRTPSSYDSDHSYFAVVNSDGSIGDEISTSMETVYTVSICFCIGSSDNSDSFDFVATEFTNTHNVSVSKTNSSDTSSEINLTITASSTSPFVKTISGLFKVRFADANSNNLSISLLQDSSAVCRYKIENTYSTYKIATLGIDTSNLLFSYSDNVYENRISKSINSSGFVESITNNYSSTMSYIIEIYKRNFSYTCSIDDVTLTDLGSETRSTCNYTGSLTQGATFTDSNYTYRYKMKYTNNGWVNVDDDGWGAKITSPSSSSVTDTPCLALQNKPLDTSVQSSNSVVVNLDANDGTIASSATGVWDGSGSSAKKIIETSYKYGTLPTPTRTGYYFLGWYTASSGGSLVTPNTYLSSLNYHTLYAHWYQSGSSSGNILYNIIQSNASSATINFSVRSGTSGTNGIYTTTETETGNPVYYYRGNVNNHVIFNNMCWRIVRTTETGGVKLIYNGTPSSGTCVATGTATQLSSTKAFNSSYNDNAYVGYMYGTVGSSTYAATHNNTNNSTIKTYIDSWYSTNFTSSSVTSKIEDTVYCNDRSIVAYDSTKFSNSNYASYGTLGYGTNGTLYGAINRASYYTITPSPTLVCSQANDKFTVSSSNGNGALTYPVGLITLDEAVFAGFNTNSSNSSDYIDTNNYLYTGSSYWTISPIRLNYDGGNAYVGYVDGSGVLYNGYYVNGTQGVRPVISLKRGVTVTGSGTSSSPYVVSGILDTGYPTVTYDANGGTVSPSSGVQTYGTYYTNLPTPTKTGSFFEGWYTAASGGSEVTTSTIVTNGSDHTLYAHWTTSMLSPGDFTFYVSGTAYDCSTNTTYCQYYNDGNDDWRIKFYTSGTLYFNSSIDIDIFLVGGGGGGGSGSRGYCYASAGGGGGYTNTVSDKSVVTGVGYTITVGAGGAQDTDGSASSFSGTINGSAATFSANGGAAGGLLTNNYGGDGGSGGGSGGANGSSAAGAAGGSYGNDGGAQNKSGGTGQHTTTCEFGLGTTSGCNSGVTAYSGGGGGGGGSGNGNYSGGSGGSGGGGAGGAGSSSGSSGTANTGGGGGGAGGSGYGSHNGSWSACYGTANSGGSGGSGIVIIRNSD